MDIEENLILDRIKKHDKEAFRFLYEYYFTKIVLFAESYLYDEEEARDLVQDLFFHLWDSLRGIARDDFNKILFVYFRAKSLFEYFAGSED